MNEEVKELKSEEKAVVRPPSQRGQGRKPSPRGIKIKGCPYEPEILEMVGKGIKTPDIVRYLEEKRNFKVSISTVNEYVRNFVISDKSLQVAIAVYLKEMDSKRSETAAKIPSTIVELINKKRRIIEEFESRIKIVKLNQEKLFSTSNEYLIEKYYTSIHNINLTIEKYLVEYEIESLISMMLRRFLTITLETFLSFVSAIDSDKVLSEYKTRILEEFKMIREMIYSKK